MNNNVAQKLYDLLGTKFDNTTIKTLDSKGKETTDMEEIEMFSFDFVAGKRNYGAVVILLSAKENLEVYYGDNTSKTLDSEARKKWENFIEHLSTFARANRLGFSLKHTTDLKYDLSNIADITESYKNIFEGYYGTSRTSYNPQGKAKIIIKHSKAIGEDDARFRNINTIFIENADGERFKLPFKKLAGARAMARHVTEGGNPYDLFGLHITEMVKDINTLGSFVRRSKMYEGNDDATNLVEAGRTHYNNLRKNLKTISGVRGYGKYKESWEPASITEQDLDTDKIRSLFLEKSVSSRVEAALPLLAQLYELANEQSDEVITELDAPDTKIYKEFKIEVKPWKKGFAATARNRAGKKVVKPQGGKTEEEAVEAVQAELDKFIGHQKKVSGAASVNLNVQFAATHLRAGETEIWGKLIPGPKLVIAGDEALEMGPEFLKSEGFAKTGRRNRPGSEGLDLLGFKMNPARAQASQAIANGRYIITDYSEDKDSNKVYGLEFDSVVSGTEEKFTFTEPALTVATARQNESIGEEFEMKEITEFEEWADKVVAEDELTEGTWAVPETRDQLNALRDFLSQEQPLGVDAMNATDALSGIIGDDELFDNLGDAADTNPDGDARPVVIQWIRDTIKQYDPGDFGSPSVIRNLKRAIQGVREGMDAELDADEEVQLDASVNRHLDNYIQKEDVDQDLEEAKKKKSSPADLKATGYDNEVGDWTAKDEEEYQAKMKKNKKVKEEVTESADFKDLMTLTNRILKG